MSDIVKHLMLAKQDKNQLNKLIVDYLPFIKKQLVGLKGLRLEYDDMLSLAMLTFSGCVSQYDFQKGNFLAFCSACIKNRLIDESRKQQRYESKTMPFFEYNGEAIASPIDAKASVEAYNLKQEQQSLSQEIEAFSIELKSFGIDFSELPRICPKQSRSRLLCIKLADEIVSVPALYDSFILTQRISQGELSSRLSISKKTVEKHRKYIVTLVLLKTGEYPYIQAFLPKKQEVN